MKLIDADALKKEIHRYALDVYCINLENSKEFAGYSTGENYCEGLYEATELIDNLPTIDAVPVVHGHWVYNKDTGEIRCNLCNALVGVTMYSDDVEPIAEVENFCFNCGAKMDEVSK